jgi:formylglycine-generating enzyme required for sulfatase activity
LRWCAKHPEEIAEADRDFIVLSRKAAHRRRLRVRALIGVLASTIVAGLIGWLNQDFLREQLRQFVTIRPYMETQVRPHVLSAQREQALKPKDSFRECAKACPLMVVVPAGEFMMGSPLNEKGRDEKEGRQHKVVLAKPFAVSQFEVTFDEWDACVDYGDCPRWVSDSGYGRGRMPVINVSWDEAKRYTAWLSRITGKTYRLLSEAEWEYAARAGTATAYSWGDEIGKGNANCDGCGSQWDNRHTAPVGSFAPNAFALHDMHGNVWEWVEDCGHNNYDGAPQDGSAWAAGDDCARRVNRGGSWNNPPNELRAASRIRNARDFRNDNTGFRVARTLLP